VDVSHGVLVVNANGTLLIHLLQTINGSDFAVVSICDAGNPMPASCVNDTIFITVNAINDPPVLDNENVSTNEDTPVGVILPMPVISIPILPLLRQIQLLLLMSRMVFSS